ncbi:MAG: LamG domain-containing protein, partial [Caulobacteraceae bacterium]|nr:LamG domain-containing protein [Caulobacteraceae bacterium]
YFDGYLANVHLIDGQALTPSSFTETDATTGQLIPKAYTGSYGTNGFYLKFDDNSSNTASTLGKDTSPNGNNWTPNNLQTATGGPTSVASASGALPIYNTTDTYGATKGSGDRTDSNSSSIVLAIPMDGANNGTTFTDESATIKGSGSAKSITRNGDTKTSTAQSKFYGSSGYFDGSGDYLTNSDITDFNFDTGDFTIECWIYHSSTGSNEGYSDTGTSISSATGGQWFLYKTSSDKVSWGQHGAGAIITSATSIVSQAWTHIAICRASSAVKIYINGILDAQATSSVNFNNGGTLRIGAVATPYYLNGYMQDFRVYKGVAKYTSNFNPPSSTQNPTIAAGNDSLVDVPTNGAQTDT